MQKLVEGGMIIKWKKQFYPINKCLQFQGNRIASKKSRDLKVRDIYIYIYIYIYIIFKYIIKSIIILYIIYKHKINQIDYFLSILKGEQHIFTLKYSNSIHYLKKYELHIILCSTL